MSSKTALVTGASGSIGSAVATFLLKKNYDVLATHHHHPNRVPSDCVSTMVDFREPESAVERIIEQLQTTELTNLNLVLHAAGITSDNLLLKTPVQDWKSVRSINLDAAYYLASSLGDRLKEESNSHFIVFTSYSGLRGRTGQSNYASTKAALIGFMRSLAREWAPDVQVNAIRPPVTKSKMTQEMDEAELEEVTKRSLNGALSSPEALVDTLRYLINSKRVNGQIISCDDRVDSNW